ncbi:hypothetical protein HMPREF0670_02782 [Prevotella sp. oral taxon 317 str. F0108]|nr:hypothetical protein HMPREF0670_02782 [Prevotella sp. oral taxon 317 str. F0108]
MRQQGQVYHLAQAIAHKKTSPHPKQNTLKTALIPPYFANFANATTYLR